MKYLRHVAMLLGAAGIAMVAMSTERTYSQGNNPNAYPNPYQVQENWAKLPRGASGDRPSVSRSIQPTARAFGPLTAARPTTAAVRISTRS